MEFWKRKLTINEKYNIKSKHHFLIKSIMTKPNKYHIEPPN